MFFNLFNSPDLLLNFSNNDIHQNNTKLKSVWLLISVINVENKFI